MEDIIFKIIGALGLLLIISGMLFKNKFRYKRDEVYVVGGLCLLTYSILLKDVIFIILQVVFTLVATYDFFKNIKKKK